MASASSNSTIPLAAGADALSPPPGTNWLAAIRPSLTFLMIGSTMGSILIAMLIALIFFSTPEIRRKPIFIFNVTAVVLGVCDSILNGYGTIHSILSPDLPEKPGIIIAFGCFDSFTPILVDTILLLRLYAVYPPSQTPRTKFIAIMAFPVLLKIGRVVNGVIYLTNYSQNMRSLVGITSAPAGGMVLITSSLPNVKIEWFIQIFDDAYCSILFLLRLKVDSAWPGQLFTRTQTSFGQRLKTLFWISVTNFVFPSILSIAQLAIYMSSSNYLLALYVEEVNFHLTIVGVVFATVWSTANGHMRSREPTEPDTSMFIACIPGLDTSGSTVLELSQPCESHASCDVEKANAPSSPYHLEGPLGLAL